MPDQKTNACPTAAAAAFSSLASSPLITVAICTRNRARLLEKAVHSVRAQLNDHAELLIVDNGSTDHTNALVARFTAADPRIRIAREPQTGLSLARNCALRKAQGDWVVFLDDDATVEPGWLAAYETFLSRPPGARVAVAGGPVMPQYEIPPPKWMNVETKWGPDREKPFCFEHGSTPAECNSAYRRDIALQFGGFDVRLGHCGEVAGCREGADLNLRLQDAGYEIWWLPGAPILHLVHARRLNLRWFLHAAFNEGRSIAIQRVKCRAPGVRRLYIAGRELIAPFHCGINLLLALAAFPFQNGRVAAKALFRAASIAGFARELLKQF